MVSVVMIAYNKAGCIAEAIAGVVRQRTDFDVELIIMDDCSTDATPEIIREWHARYPDIIRPVRNERNLGLQGNYMAGFRLCRGKYMAICDADDYWCSRRKLARQVRYMEAHPDCHVSFHRMVNFYEDTGEKSLSNGGTKTITTLADLSRSNYITNSSVMYRRERVDLQHLPAWVADITAPDYAMHMLYAAEGHIRFFGRPMGVYRKAAGSAWSMTRQLERLRMSVAVRERLLEHYADRPEAATGLREAIAALQRSMEREAAGTPQQVRRSVLSRVRAAVSRVLPLPKP